MLDAGGTLTRPPEAKRPPPIGTTPPPVGIPDASVLDASVTDATVTDTGVVDTSIRDLTAPVFAGVQTAIADSTQIDLRWNLAVDDLSPGNEIRYRIYVSTRPRAPTRSTPPTVVSERGVTSALVPNLSSRTTYYVVVHAVDNAGNEERNDFELEVKTLTSFSGDVQPIFTTSCALPGCHVPGAASQGVIFSEGYAYNSTVDKVAGEGGAINRPDIKRIDSRSSDPFDSYVWWTIQDPLPAIMKSSPMPPLSAMSPFGDAERQIIGDWIREGAREN
jgi:hypothetical protein